MFYDIISELEIAVDKEAWRKHLKTLGERIVSTVSMNELLAEFLDTYEENLDDIDWEYSPTQFLVSLNEPIEGSVAKKNEWRDYTEPEEEMDNDEEDYRRDPYSPWNY